MSYIIGIKEIADVFYSQKRIKRLRLSICIAKKASKDRYVLQARRPTGSRKFARGFRKPEI